MSITLDDNAVDVFKLYDELAVAYAKDIDGYKSILKAIEVMIVQKEEVLDALKNQTLDLIKSSLSAPAVSPSMEAPSPQSVKKFNYAGVDENDLAPENVVSGLPDAVPDKEMPPKSERTRQKKTSQQAKRKIVRSEKPKKQPLQSKSTAEKSWNDRLPPKASKRQISRAESTGDDSDIKCLYHPEIAAADHGRQLCSSCKWKLINSGLLNFHKEPEVIAFLKGEITKFPNLGQSMCPIHPEVPSYNRKTALCKVCQKKANGIGIQNRQLNEEELNLLRNPSL